MKELIETMVRWLAQGESFVLATLFARAGSAPRAAGARMLIREDGTSVGTIGGGLLDAQAQKSAVELFTRRGAVAREFSLAGEQVSEMDMVCGGDVEVLIEFVDATDSIHRDLYEGVLEAMGNAEKAWLLTQLPAPSGGQGPVHRCLVRQDGSITGAVTSQWTVGGGRGSPIGLFGAEPDQSESCIDLASAKKPVLAECGPQRLLVEPVFGNSTVYIFGAGHISRQLAPLCKLVGFETVVLDDRAVFASAERFEAVDQLIVLDSFEDALGDLSIRDDSFVVIVTRGHTHDQAVLAQALRTNTAYIGMIGSVRKRDAVYHALAEEGFAANDFSRVHSPIGLSIGAETPEEIAVCIVAELIQVRAERE